MPRSPDVISAEIDKLLEQRRGVQGQVLEVRETFKTLNSTLKALDTQIENLLKEQAGQTSLF